LEDSQVIFHTSLKKLKRKTVSVKGLILEHEGKTQIEIRAERQIKI